MIAHRTSLRKPSFQGGEGQGRFGAHTEDTRIWNITFYYAHIQPTPTPHFLSCFYVYLGPPDPKPALNSVVCGARLDFWSAQPMTIHLLNSLWGVSSLSPTYSLAVIPEA